MLNENERMLENKLIREIETSILTLTKGTPPTRDLEDVYLAGCAKALEIKTEVTDYVEQEIHDPDLLQMKLEILKNLIKSLGMEKEMGD